MVQIHQNKPHHGVDSGNSYLHNLHSYKNKILFIPKLSILLYKKKGERKQDDAINKSLVEQNFINLTQSSILYQISRAIHLVEPYLIAGRYVDEM